MIIQHLVAAKFADAEILRFRMSKIKPADGTGGPHGVAFGQFDGCDSLRIQQLPENAFFSVWSGLAG